MARPSRSGRRRREPLSRERVLRAAFDLAVEGGLEAVTMQTIGRRLGVQAMSLYRHVRNKDDILSGIVDLLVSQIDRPDSGGWKTALRQWAISAHEVFARNRWAMGLIESLAHPGAATLRHHEWMLGVLLEAGFTSVTAVSAYNVLDSYVYGFALQETSSPLEGLEEQADLGRAMLKQLRDYPNLTRVTLEFLESGAYVFDFESGLDLILDGLQRVVATA